MSDEPVPLNIEELSAYVDGELPGPRAAIVAKLVEHNPVWARALAEMRAVDDALDQWCVPGVPAGLAEQIVLASRREVGRLRWWALRVSASIAAAAAIVLVALVLRGGGDLTTDPHVTSEHAVANAEIREEDERLIVENLDFFRDFEVVDNYETLEAIERLEQTGYGT
jgi:anti-sigma factor RsiW